jgi:hypothetical protein
VDSKILNLFVKKKKLLQNETSIGCGRNLSDVFSSGSCECLRDDRGACGRAAITNLQVVADDADSSSGESRGLEITMLASTREVMMEARENICNANALRRSLEGELQDLYIRN